MNVALTGATGFIGSHVLQDLQEHGHTVTALVRNDEQAGIVAAQGATPPRSTSTTGPRSSSLLKSADGAIHTASPGDETSADLDSAVVDAVIEALSGTASPTSTSAGCGSTEPTRRSATTLQPIRPRWWPGSSRSNSACSMPGHARRCDRVQPRLRRRRWRHPGLLLNSPRDDAGNLIMLGSGRQHWSTVHVADLADAFRRVLERDSARGRYVVGNGLNPSVAELTEAAAVAAGAAGAVAGSDDEARTRLGDYFAEVLLLDQGSSAARARAELGWDPSRPGLVDEFRHGSYADVAARS